MESRIETDLVSTFLASTCAVTIGLHLSWWPQDNSEGQPPELPEFKDEQLENLKATMYLVAIGWSQWSGANVVGVGPYSLMVFGVFVSVCAGALASAYPCQVHCLYAVRALQGFGSASLAVAVPEYIMTRNANVTGPFQNNIPIKLRHVQALRRETNLHNDNHRFILDFERSDVFSLLHYAFMMYYYLFVCFMLCLIEVFIVVGELISHSLSLLMTWTHMNLAITGITSLNIVSLILLHFTSCRYNDRMTVCHYHRTDSSVGPYRELLRDPNLNSNQDISGSSSTSYQFTNGDKCFKKKLQWCVFVCLTLFVFRDFSCVHVFKKSIHCIFAELNVKPVSYEQCALLVTALQLMVTTFTAFLVQKYGRRKFLLASSLGMLLAATGLGLIIFNSNAITSVKIRHVCIMFPLVLYIICFAQGVSSIPWAMPFKNIQRNVRSYAIGFIISAHFLFLMTAEYFSFNEEHFYSPKSKAAYWLMFFCFGQSIFVYTFVMNIKS